MADLENSVELARRALDELRANGSLTSKTLGQLNRAAKDAAGDVNKLGDQADDTASRFKDLDKKIVSVVQALTQTAVAVRENRDNFTSLNPAIRASGIAVGTAGRKIGDTVAGIGDALMGLSTFFGPKGKLIGMLGGAALSGLGRAVGASSDAMAQLATQFGEFATGELQRTVDAYRELGSVGAIGSGGMTQLYDQSIQAGLGIGQFAAVIARNSTTLAASTGTTERGAKTIANMAEASRGVQNQFLALGMSFDQQRDFQAKFLEQNRLVNRISLGDTRALSEASHDYMKQIDELSRITGMQREEAQRSLADLNRNIRFRASQRMAINQYGADVGRQMQNFAAVIGNADKLMGEGVADIFSGTATDAAQAVQIATNNQAKAIADMVRSGVITANQGAEMIQKAMREKIAGLGGDAFLAFTGKVEGPLQNYLLGMDNIAQAQNLTVESMNEAKTAQTDAATAQDKNTKNVVTAQEQLQQLAITLDKIVKEKVFPHAATAVKNFTSILEDSITYIAEKLNLDAPGRRNDRNERATQDYNNSSEFAGMQEQSTPAATPEETGVPAAGGSSPAVGGTPPGGGANAPDQLSVDKLFNFLGGTTGHRSHYEKLDSGFRDRLTAMAREYNELTGRRIDFSSGARSEQENRRVGGVGSSNHLQGKAADLTTSSVTDLLSHGLLDKYGFKQNSRSAWHISDTGYRDGGIASGPKSGYQTTLHGTEAIVPLPGGRSIPVEMTGMADKMSEQIGVLVQQNDMMGEMISLMRNSVEMQGKIYRATSQ
jgi:hypothetical protein